MSREISAIDRRNVLRFQRTKIACIVPIVEMAAEAFQPGHRLECRFQPLGGGQQT